MAYNRMFSFAKPAKQAFLRIQSPWSRVVRAVKRLSSSPTLAVGYASLIFRLCSGKDRT